MTSSNHTVPRPLAIVRPLTPTEHIVGRPEHEHAALQVCLEQGLSDDAVAERVLTQKAYAAFVNIRIRQLMIREQELAA